MAIVEVCVAQNKNKTVKDQIPNLVKQRNQLKKQTNSQQKETSENLISTKTTLRREEKELGSI